ncbi:antibiotic biosynthesis monooxygenase [Prauserella endophytica]|uniref:ABM domain-containing protein n=1 Tax=Prauserella endophytica TaxID=1592324 RepID=A0ABY2SAE7_9PSEU|nr:antibiotic biosynthesis monooxygenase [Prauserella endophytica]PXY29119.1 hypothetical protein BAY59_15955 [Prauserella coralliicola]TKG72807.1 hypothetical protein FCN18_06175 [Prauserella endophytica]
MHARSTTIWARTASIDDGVAHVRDEVMPTALEMDGCVGLSMLVNREDGRCIVTTAWETAEAMQASAEAAGALRERARELLGGDMTIDEWEIAVLHRDHRVAEGACARATWLRVEPGQIDRMISVFTDTVLPSLESFEGFCSASLMIDRTSGRCVGSVAYDSVEAMRRSRERADEVRAGAIRESGAERLDVAEFELAIAHLRVPELA